MASGSAGGAQGGGRTSGGGAGRSTAASSRRAKYVNATSKRFGGYGGVDSITTSRRRGGTRQGIAGYFLPF